MRKINSEFHTSFVSHEGMQLVNHDYYGCVELDKFACYIVVDGIETDGQTESAKIAADAVAMAFSEKPSISKGALRSYLRSAHKSLISDHGKTRMKASIAIVVTDYAKIRYAHAGNTRFALFRSGHQIRHSEDHSLTQQLARKNEIPKDKIAKHEERQNLTRYLGQEGRLNPAVSRKIKLKDGDILALFTRGFWEHCDPMDMSAAFQQAGKDPKAATELAERLLLDLHPEQIDNYTLAAIFVDKVYKDPNKGKKLKLLLSIGIPILLMLLIFGIVFYVRYQKKQENRRNMELYLLNGIEYIQGDNYLKAKDELKQAYDLSLKLKDGARTTEISNYQKLAEAVINADDLLSQEDYETAVQAYLHAADRAKYTDNLGKSYIDARLESATGFINVQDLLGLGDSLADQGNFSMAEEKYLAARSLAAKIYYLEGKKQAIESLNSLYEKMDQEVEQSKEQSQAEITASDFIVQGNTAFQSGDLVSAEMYYTMAKEKYEKLGDETMAASMEEKLSLIAAKQEADAQRLQEAAVHMERGSELQNKEKYADAKKEFILAREIYASLNDEENLKKTEAKIEIIDGYLTGSQKK
mgnify:FL=1